MVVSDEEFAKQLWSHDWYKIDSEHDPDEWVQVDEEVRQSYRDVVSFINDSEWLQNIRDEAYQDGHGY